MCLTLRYCERLETPVTRNTLNTVCPPLSLSCFILYLQVVVPVSEAQTQTIPIWCTRTSVTDECVLWAAPAAPRMAVAAATMAATAETAAEEAAVTVSAPLHLPLLTEIAAAETEVAATAPAPTPTTSTRITTAAAVSTAAPGPAPGQGVAGWVRTHLLHQAPSLWWHSSSTLPRPWWGWWGTHHFSFLLKRAESDVICTSVTCSTTQTPSHKLTEKCWFIKGSVPGSRPLWHQHPAYELVWVATHQCTVLFEIFMIGTWVRLVPSWSSFFLNTLFSLLFKSN